MPYKDKADILEIGSYPIHKHVKDCISIKMFGWHFANCKIMVDLRPGGPLKIAGYTIEELQTIWINEHKN